MLNTKNITISKDTSKQDDTDFQFLKDKGIEYIEAMGSALWTDYNEHDPGITMLEVLSYAITDLGNRMSFPMQDLLANVDNEGIGSQFYTADEILPTKSVTANDYRKLFIDIVGVRNCWIQKFHQTIYANCKDGELSYNPESFAHIPNELKNKFNLKGLNCIIVDYDLDPDLSIPEKEVKIEEINGTIKKVYHQNRNLCEDLIDIKPVETQSICFCSDIELERNADPTEVHAKILFEIDNYFLPRIKFYSIKEMLQKGYRTDEIFDGPLLENGFIDDAELISSEQRDQVRLSDLINLIADIPGVKNINEISISDCDGESSGEQWIICIESGKRPILCDNSTFTYKKDILPVPFNEQQAKELLYKLIEQAVGKFVASSEMILSIPEGDYLDLGNYTTIQNDFPDTYGIGINGLSSNQSVARKAKAKQLKAYLLFFDQILATYFSYLSNVKDLLAINPELKQVYFTEAIQGLNGLSEIVTNYPEDNNQQLSQNLLGFLVDTDTVKNDILDHLLARFAEKFSDYTFLLHDIYGSMASEMNLLAKSTFLKEYIMLSSGRGLGFDYFEQSPGNLWNTNNVAGAVKRIARLTGMKNYDRRNLVNEYVAMTIHVPTPGVEQYGWSIHNDLIQIILTSYSQAFSTIEEAVQCLYRSTLLVTETTPEEVESALEDLEPDTYVLAGNLEIEQVGTSFSFRVIDYAVPSSEPNRILAVSQVYVMSKQDFTVLLLELLDFMKYRYTEEGLFLVEHILLRPMNLEAPFSEFLPFCADDCADGCCIDPYSFKVTIVLPGYTQRFSNIDFRNFMEQLICEEIPSHIIPKICWVGNRKNAVTDEKNDLLHFEEAFKAFLEVKTDPNNEISSELETLIKCISDLNTIYPKGVLADCDNLTDPKIILGRSKIGSLGSNPETE